MKKGIILKGLAVLILGLAVMSLSTCDQWISITVYIENHHGSDTIAEAWLENKDGDVKDSDSTPIPPGGYTELHFSQYDEDKYTKMTAYIRIGSYIYSSTGNVAENDWITVIIYDGTGSDDFY